MKLSACLLVLAASLCAAQLFLEESRALAQGGPQAARAAIQPGRVQLLGADMAANCKAEDIDRAHRLADACEGRQRCSFTPQAGDAATEACARDSMALWDCGDGKTRYAPLGPQGASQGREITLECAAVAVATPAPATAQPAPKDKTETVKVDGLKDQPTLNIVAGARNTASIDMSAAGVSRECDRGKKTEWDGMPGHAPTDAQRIANIHANIYAPPDHSPDSALHSPGQFGPVRGEVGNRDCY